MEELDEEIKDQSQECIDDASCVLSVATEMLKLMESVEKLLQ